MARQALYEAEVARHHRSGGRTRRFEHGIPLEPTASLRITDDGGDGAYLVLIDAGGYEQSESWHQSIGLAMCQAEFEFGVGEDGWIEVSGFSGFPRTP
jgi:hypothetical protein